MLEVNLAHADAELQQFITNTCSEIGQVMSVKGIGYRTASR